MSAIIITEQMNKIFESGTEKQQAQIASFFANLNKNADKTEKEVVKNNLLIKLAKKIEDGDSKADKIIASNKFIKALVKNFEDENSCSVKVKL